MKVCASNLVKVDLHGNIIGDQAQEINPAGFVIHSAIHMARRDVQCIMHTHTVAGMAVAALQTGLLPISMYALGYFERVAYHDFEGPSLDLEERQRLASNLGDKNVLILRTHGLLTCGQTVAQAFVRMFRLERACQVQLSAQADDSNSSCHRARSVRLARNAATISWRRREVKATAAWPIPSSTRSSG